MLHFSIFVLTILTSFAAVDVAQAQQLLSGGTGNDISIFTETILSFIQTVIIPFILGIGFLVFVWGMFQYFIRGGANDEAKESGKSLIMYAIAGYVVILAFWGIVTILSGGLGLEQSQDEIELPIVRPQTSS